MIIGVVGPIGSGKSVFSRRLAAEGFERLGFSDILRELMRIKGIEVSRKNLQDFGDELRRKEGLGALAKRLIEQMSEGEDYVIDGFRNPGEIEEFKKLKDFHLIFVNSPYEVRRNRIVGRGRDSDPKSDEEFKIQDERDFGVGQDECGQQNAKCFEMADIEVANDDSLEEFYERIEEILEGLRKKS